MNFVSVLFMLFISVHDGLAFRNRNDHLCSVLENTHKSYYNNQYHFCRTWNRRRTNRAGLKTPQSNRGGKNGAASNDGILIQWEKVSGDLLLFVLLILLADITPRLGPEEAEHRGWLLLLGQGQRLGQGGSGAVGQAGSVQSQWGHP